MIGPHQVKFAKRLLKNEAKLRWSVWPQWIHGLCRLWKQTSPQRIPCGLHPENFLLVLNLHALCLSASHAGCIPAGLLRKPVVRHFASAHPMRVASVCVRLVLSHSTSFASTHPMRVASGLHSGLLQPRGSLPQRIPCGLHQNRWKAWSVNWNFASAHPMRVASAKMHKIHSMDL